MHQVVRKTHSEEHERFLSKLERGKRVAKRACFPREKVGTNPKEDICFIDGLFFSCGKLYCMDSYSPYNK
jgi:hypothetical protein